MRTIKNNIIYRLPMFLIFMVIYSITCSAQQSDKAHLPSLNLVPAGLAKSNFQLYSDKNQKIKLEIAKFKEEKKLFDKKLKESTADQTKSELALLISKENELKAKINLFNAEIEEVVYNDPALDKLSTITYYSLKNDRKLWDEFQKNIVIEKTNLKQDKVKIRQELTKINIKKQKNKTPFNEGIVLSMYAEQELNKRLEDSLKSPFTGMMYKEMTENREKNMTDSGVVIVSFVMPKQQNDPLAAASQNDGHVPSEMFSLAGPKAKAELNKLKDKKFNRLIAHSNGATVVECLLNDSLIEVKELNIIGGEKSLLNGQALQRLLDNGKVKRVVLWIKLDDPAIWITNLSDENITQRTENFITYKTKFEKTGTQTKPSKVEYKWILGSGSLASLSAKDPQFISTYFREISKDLRAK
ncbi:MAG: hypothetical protein K8R85_10260 [Bacteroidetes bacterium]|nr:hypothetical protein [Bacteroidota bacterium]